jgi:catechol 2,3-dioxygenase-like lactoylglutathione lyase family enzyme
MIDHVSVAVHDLIRSSAFYGSVLAPLGLTRLVVRETAVGFGKEFPEFWINHRPQMPAVPSDPGAHVALRTRTPDQVDAFHAAALAAGGQCDGPPGLRPHDRVRYYAAFVRDLDGNRVEAVTFLP